MGNKKYYQKNREKILKQQKEYYLKNKEKRDKYNKEYCKKNREKIKKYWRKWYAKNRKRQREVRRNYLAKIKMEVLCHYGGNPPCCACCGETILEFLTIDHIKGGGKEHRQKMKSQNIYLDLRKNGYPEGIRILCWNCNSTYGLYGYCPHNNVTTCNTL